MKYEEAATPYTASYLIIRQAGKMAFVLRENTPWMNGYWGLPSGRVDRTEADSESFIACGVHEAEEEVGIEVEPEDLKHLLTMHRLDSESDMVWVDVFFEVTRWKGDVYNAEPHKHKRLDFFADGERPENIIPATQFALEAIAAGKTYAEYGWKEGK